MAATQDKQERSPGENQRASELSFAEKLIEFIQRNRKILFVGFVAIAVALIGSIIGLTVRERVTANAFLAIDGFEQRHLALMEYIGSEDVGALFRQGEITALLEELALFAARNSGFAAARAHGMRAAIFERQERWPLVESSWVAAANAAPGTYFAPIALFNAAVAAEEQGNLETALDLYTRVQAHENASFLAVRAQFSVGRLEEARNNTEAALSAYRLLLSRWPHDALFASLAQSRIITLTEER